MFNSEDSFQCSGAPEMNPKSKRILTKCITSQAHKLSFMCLCSWKYAQSLIPAWVPRLRYGHGHQGFTVHTWNGVGCSVPTPQHLQRSHLRFPRDQRASRETVLPPAAAAAGHDLQVTLCKRRSLRTGAYRLHDLTSGSQERVKEGLKSLNPLLSGCGV